MLTLPCSFLPSPPSWKWFLPALRVRKQNTHETQLQGLAPGAGKPSRPGEVLFLAWLRRELPVTRLGVLGPGPGPVMFGTDAAKHVTACKESRGSSSLASRFTGEDTHGQRAAVTFPRPHSVSGEAET